MAFPSAPESQDSVFGSPTQTNSLAATGTDQGAMGIAPPNPFDPKKLLDLFDKLKRESFENRWVWEREWLRDLFYISNRQWITYHPTRREWVDKRLHKWIPRPVTNKMAEILQSIRTNLAAIDLTVKVRPLSNDTQSVAAAEAADQMAPLIHEEHNMNQVMREADFWLIVTGNACLHLSWDLDKRSNLVFIPHEQCLTCGTVIPPQDLQQSQGMCPTCGGTQFDKAQDPNGTPIGETVSFGKGKTRALSPLEYAFPANVTRWDDLPYIVLLRWRDKGWFEANRPDLLNKISWEKSPTDRSLQIFKSLALTNDIGTNAQFASFGAAGSSTVEGVTEYEVWLKPTPEFPEGLVMRVIGEKSPILLEVPEEQLPGPFPYKDIEGRPLFPFMHAQYEHIGGRLYGRSAISPLIQKQDQLNQLDSLVQLIIQRTANPAWIMPESAGVEQITGEPGLIVRWNPLTAGGQGKPERIDGQEIPQSLMALREQILKDMEELSGAFDIIKGQKPSGVEAFSALQLLVERSQSRFTAVFQARGEMYRKWFSIALELERQFGPDQRVFAVLGPNKGYTFEHFQNAKLQGAVSVQIEDGSNMPKTALGKRAAIEQANQLQLLNPADPDQRYTLLQQFGLTELAPTLNVHVQAALGLQDAFERWAQNPVGPSPLVFKPWFDPQIHWVERIKWLNSDRMKQVLAQNPSLEPYIMMHLQELQFMMMPPPQAVGPDGKPLNTGPNAPGGGQAMSSSNANSGSTRSVPSGNAQSGPNMGPV